MKIDWQNYKYEYLLYIALLGIALLFPFLRVGDMSLEGDTFQWQFILQAWIELLPFAVLLLLHTVFLLPILLYKRRPWRYVLCTFLLLCSFSAYTYFQFRNKFEQMPVRLPSQMQQLFPQGPDDFPPVPQFAPPPMEKGIPRPVIFNTLFAIMLLGTNLAIRLMFKYYLDMRKMEELEKTQISPHFFMNSLNNIHGMVEIDPPKAQEMIIELSGMMKYVLYESTSRKIPLSKEIDFISNYVALMRMRYTPNRVSIKLDLPDKNTVGNILVPPLLFINFIENAFKHGVDYREHSFIDVELTVEKDLLVFRCANSVHKITEGKNNSGIGLANIRKRLDILYAGKYVLHMEEQKSIYNLILRIQC